MENFDFEASREWYLDHGSDRVLIMLLKKHTNSSYLRERLKAEMQKVKAEKESKEKFVESYETYAENKRELRDYSKAPKEVQELVNKKAVVWLEMNMLHASLHTQDYEGRSKAAFRILELRDELAKLWQQINFFSDNGKLPEEEKEPKRIDFPETLSQLIKRRNTVRTYVSKGRGKGDQYKKELDALEAEIRRRELA